MSEPAPVVAALAGVCPRCGQRTLFAGMLEFAPKCPRCGLDFSSFNVGDGAAAFLILIVGAILTAAAITVELAFEPPYWVHAVWLPVGAALTIAGLRAGKAFLLGQEWRVSHPGGMAADCSQQSEPDTRHRAREGRLAP